MKCTVCTEIVHITAQASVYAAGEVDPIDAVDPTHVGTPVSKTSFANVVPFVRRSQRVFLQ